MPAGQGLQEVHTDFTFKFDGSRLAAVERGVKRSVTGLNTIAQQTDVFQQRMGGFFARAKQVIGVYLGFRAIRSITTDYATAADTVAKFATATGLSTETYQGLVHAVKIGGSDQENLNKALTQLSKRALEAGQGLKTNQRAFNELGVSWKDASGHLKTADRLFLEISDAFVGMTDESKRTGLSMQLLGRTGAKLLPTMLEGSKGIKALIDQAKKLGIVLSKEQLKAAENFNDEMLRVKSVLTGIRNTIAAKLLPTITRQLKAFQMWWREGNNAERAMRALKLTAIFTAAVLARMVGARVIKGIMSFVQGIIAGVRALRAMNFQLLLAQAKTLLIVAAVALFVLAIEDLIGFAQGKDSVIGRLLGDTSEAKALKDAIVGIGKAAVSAWREIKPALLSAWSDLKPAITELWVAIKPLIGPALKIGIGAFVSGIKLISFFAKEAAKNISLMIWFAKQMKSNITTALGPVVSMFTFLVKQAERVLQLMGLISGKEFLDPARLREQQEQGRQAAMRQLGKPRITTGPRGERVVTRYTKPIEEILGGAQERAPMGPIRSVSVPTVQPATMKRLPPVTNITTNVAPGAIVTRVDVPSSDPRAIAREANNLLTERIQGVFTDASRDLVRPPRGQE
jgi:hypothetical protein